MYNCESPGASNVLATLRTIRSRRLRGNWQLCHIVSKSECVASDQSLGVRRDIGVVDRGLEQIPGALVGQSIQIVEVKTEILTAGEFGNIVST
jgi:hypothetical protein